MKMKKYYPILKSRAEYWFSDVFNRQRWAEYVTVVQKSGEYSDIYVRLAWDMARMFTTAKKVGMDVGYF